MQRSKFRILSLFTIGLIAIAATGCTSSSEETIDPATTPEAEATSTETPADEDSTSSSGTEGDAVFTYGDTTYSSQLEFCSLNESADALFHGVAYDESGTEVGYLDGDFGMLDGDAFGEVRIDFGATGPMQSSDEFIAMGDAASNIVFTDFSDTSWYVIGGAWDQDGTETPSSTLQVAC